MRRGWQAVAALQAGIVTYRRAEPKRARRWPLAALQLAAWSYLLGLGGRAVACAFIGDRWWWLFLLNALALYPFLPLPIVGVLATLRRDRALGLGVAVGLALFLVLYGELWLPRLARPHPQGTELTVMTYNILGSSGEPGRVVTTIEAAQADVVALQELTPPIAAALGDALAATYPYQILDPRPGVTGLGVISRYPLRRTSESLPGAWVGAPQILSLEVEGAAVTLLNAHAIATHVEERAMLARSIRERERQAQALVAFADAHPGPLLALMDFNAGDQNAAYAVVTDRLRDAWREAGWGWGHTFPGASWQGGSRPEVGDIPVPRWLVRIDYVLHSPEWRTVSAQLGPGDGRSDHRPVIARLVLTRRHR